MGFLGQQLRDDWLTKYAKVQQASYIFRAEDTMITVAQLFGYIALAYVIVRGLLACFYDFTTWKLSIDGKPNGVLLRPEPSLNLNV